MKQEERRQQTIQRLMDATKQLIAEKGCHSITMQDIMTRSGMSKGAIFHHFKSKNELFVSVLLERLEQTNERFMSEVAPDRPTFIEPMQQIKESILAFENPQDVTNKVLMYLLGKEEDPMVAEAMKQYYDRSVYLSRMWIETGQHHGVIPGKVDAAKTADMFTVMTLGLRVRSSIPQSEASFTAADLTDFISNLLNPDDERLKKE